MLLRRFGSWATALLGTLAFALGSPIWSTATRALWQHGPMILFVLIAMALLLRDRAGAAKWAGAALAAAYLMRPTAAIPVLLLSGYVAWRWPRAAAGIPGLRGGGGCAVARVQLGDHRVAAAALLPGRHRRVRPRRRTGWPGCCSAQGRGLIVYVPVLLLAPWGFWLAWTAERAMRPLHLAFALCAVGGIAVVAQWPVWWGGHCYGPRLLSDVLPFLAFYTAYALHRMLHAGWAPALLAAQLVAAGIGMNAPGALNEAALRWNVIPGNIDQNPARLWDWRAPPFLAARG